MKEDQNHSEPFSDLRQLAENRLKHEKREALSLELQGDNKRLVHELHVHQIELEMQNEELYAGSIRMIEPA